MSEPTEWRTSTHVLAGMMESDDAAWNRFIARFRDPVIGFACKSGLAESDAEDVAQTTLLVFVEGLRAQKYERGKGRLRSWLFGIARRKVQEKRREREKRGTQMQSDGDTTGFWAQVPDDEDPERLWEACWERALMRQCMVRVREEVEPRTYDAFVKVALEGRAVKDVAAELEMTQNAVSIAKHRVLKRLQVLKAEIDDA